MLKFSCTTTAILFLFLIPPGVNAETIYRWTDENGIIHMTNMPPPEEVKIQEVMRFKKETAKEIREYQDLQEKKSKERLNQEKITDAQELKIKAQKAKQRAETAKVHAEEAIRRAQVGIEEYNTKAKKIRKKHRKKVGKLIEEAKEAEAQASKLIEEAQEAEKKANEANTRANQVENEAIKAGVKSP
jgi:hypothetical protein